MNRSDQTSALRRDLLLVAVAAAGVIVYALASQAMGGAGFPLDDSWIHQTYGRNLAQTGQWAFVPGVPSAGSTSPLYTVLLALGYRLGAPFIVWAHLLGIAALALAGLVGARMAERLYPAVRHIGLWTGLALVGAWHLIWVSVSGMETMLFGALTLVVMWLAWAEIDSGGDLPARFGRGALFGLAGAALIATRPEGGLLLALVGPLMLIARPQPDWRAFFAWSAGALAGGLIGLAPYALLNFSLNGTPFPNTLAAKQVQHTPLLAYGFLVNLRRMVEPLTAGAQLLLVPGALVSLIRLGGRLRARQAEVLFLAPLLWSAALIVLFALRLPAEYQHGRYVIPALPAFIVFGVGGTLSLLPLATRRGTSLALRVAIRTLMATTTLVFVIFWGVGAQIYGHEVRLIETEMVAAAHWLAANIPPDADHLLAVHDIGAVGYYAPRPILDIAGLVSPEVVPIMLDADALLSLLRARGARYLMVLPDQNRTSWLPYLCEYYKTGGLMGAEGMQIYRIAWDGRCS